MFLRKGDISSRERIIQKRKKQKDTRDHGKITG
jgi:hypothetical protein